MTAHLFAALAVIAYVIACLWLWRWASRASRAACSRKPPPAKRPLYIGVAMCGTKDGMRRLRRA